MSFLLRASRSSVFLFILLCPTMFAANNAQAAYCASSGTNNSYEWIESVTVGGVTKSSGAGAGYSDFSNDPAIDLSAGSTPILFTPGFSSGSYNEHWSVWIDLNQDNTFAADEIVFSSSSTVVLSGELVIPTTALEGATRMRISMKWGGAPGSCETFTYGEVEDYTVNIIAGGATPPPPAPPPGETPISYCPSNGSVTSYEWIERIGVANYTHYSGQGSGYSDFTNSVAPIDLAIQNNPILLTPGFNSYTYTEYWSVWIDGNQDGNFAVDEAVYTGTSNAQLDGQFNLPPNSVPGQTRMRITMKYGGAPTPCETFYYGEVLDYLVNIPGEPAGPAEPFTLALGENFEVVRSGNLDDALIWAVERDGAIVLQRNAINEMSYRYFANTYNPGDYRIWLNMSVGGQVTRVSNIVEYSTIAGKYTHTLGIGENYQLTRSGVLGEAIRWIVEENGIVVMDRDASSELSYTFEANNVDSVYRVWLQQIINGQITQVSEAIEYRPLDQYVLTVDAAFNVFRTGSLGAPVHWVVQQNGVEVYRGDASGMLHYTHAGNTDGNVYKVWLEHSGVGPGTMVSNIIEYSPGAISYPFALTVDANYQITRTGVLGDPLTWVIEKDGVVVLQRNAANELSYTYYVNTSGSNFRVWLNQFVNGGYVRVSNIAEYSVP